ncbi:hypothetical protein E6W17_20325 [Streptomyces sp. A1547]|nr:hypothetical protein E6W17_20325 [Streptomyces sp. A1547]
MIVSRHARACGPDMPPRDMGPPLVRSRRAVSTQSGCAKWDQLRVGSAFPSDGESFELVEQGEGLLHDAAGLALAADTPVQILGQPHHLVTAHP